VHTAICTLFEGDCHYGVGALTNSLYHHGFRGVVWAGYRSALPDWANSLKVGQGYQEFSVAEDCVSRFINLTTQKFLSYYKPDFMLYLWESYYPEVEALFYFDPDIVNKCRWGFYEEWVNRGIALCEDAYSEMPFNHPRRLGWLEFSEHHGYVCQQKLDRFYNAGFIGLKHSQKSLLSLWQKILETCKDEGYFSMGDSHIDVRPEGLYVYPYISDDQDALDLTTMLTSHPLSTVGTDGMDFGRPGGIMSYAAGGGVIKAWRKPCYISLLGV